MSEIDVKKGAPERVCEDEDCGEVVTYRRDRCHHCGVFLCGWCMHHVHDCAPGHSREECRDLKVLSHMREKYGAKAVRNLLDRKRALVLKAREAA
jgi:hypothetical protein